MKAHAAAAGLGDRTVVNTCMVTAESVRQSAQTIHGLCRDRPGARRIVTGHECRRLQGEAIA